MKKQLFKVASVLMAVSMVLSGFGVTAVAASTVAADGGGEIAVIVKTGNSSFWQNVQTGAMDAQKELKAQTPKLSVTFLGAQSESNVNEQINIVESAIDRGVKAIVLAPSDTKALQPAVKKAKDAGIPVIIIDSKLDGDPSQYVSFLATDNKAAGEACAKALIEGVKKATGKDSGKIAVMSYVAGVGSEVGRVGGFKDYIKANSKLEIVTTQYSNADMPTALNQTTNVLQANPDLVGIFGANEPTAIGMGRAIKEAGLSGKIVAIGFDGNSALKEMVMDGTLNAIAVQSSYNMGYLGVKTAYDVAFAGKKVDAYVDTGFLMVTKDNVDSQEAKNVLY
ncbi:MAG: ABC transporter substrate-binding protein [Chloroflexi bacterium]|jgi:ribose transport system substrate-binding protein|nr:ABC transporter substrate-binding protein [Chloroflexota bacterium]